MGYGFGWIYFIYYCFVDLVVFLGGVLGLVLGRVFLIYLFSYCEGCDLVLVLIFLSR